MIADIFRNRRGLPEISLKHTQLVAILPPRKGADVLLQHYVDHVSWLFHIIHIPTVLAQKEDIYAALSRKRMPNLSHLALMSAILASSVYFWSPQFDVTIKIGDTNSLSRRWISLAVAALSEAKYLDNPSLESIQTMIILTHSLSNPRRAATLSGVMVDLGHSMRLHQIDSRKGRAARKDAGVDAIKVEMQRRVWWHISSSDW
jgi:Fungal specific transcription factor domain